MLMANTQLSLGLVQPIFDSVNVKFTYMGNSFIMALQEQMAEIGATFWIEEAWTPKFQRKGDNSLMKQFASVKGITKITLQRANEARIWMQL